MPVEKFHSVEEMNAASIRATPTEDSFARFLRHCARYFRVRPDLPSGCFQISESARGSRRPEASRREISERKVFILGVSSRFSVLMVFVSQR